MNSQKTSILLFTAILLFSFLSVDASASVPKEGKHPILIISSYNPDSRSTAGSIYDFVEMLSSYDEELPVALENMNCRSFPEATVWKDRLRALSEKYKGDSKPSLLVLIGQEAWAAYLDLEKEYPKHDVPVIVSQVSRNLIHLPTDTATLRTWLPTSYDFFTNVGDASVKGGVFYDYDIAGNISLIRQLYPDTRNIAFISDNSYGGVSLQALMRKEMEKYADLNLILLDGRENTVYSMCDRIRKLPEHTAILIGTWRVDMYDGFSVQNSTYMMASAAGNIPTFSLTSVGVGYWAIGGIVPAYRSQGADMAKGVINWLKSGETKGLEPDILSNKLMLDIRLIKERNIDVSTLKFNLPIEYVNREVTFFERYQYYIWGTFALLIFFGGAFITVLVFYLRTKRLKDELERSQSELIIARDRAEESNRLKTSFLANMSHEIRTPLNAIVGFSDVLTSVPVSHEDAEGYARLIRINSELLLRLINDILDISRLESGKLNFKYEETEVVDVCRNLLDSFSRSYGDLNENSFRFVSSYEHLMVPVDMNRLQQVIINLLSNANKFTREGVVTLSVEPDDEPDTLRFAVTDTGIGIPEEKRQLIFERFEKLDEFVQGTGLGLSICLLTVEHWGGKIWVDPDYHQGARLIFTHPTNIQTNN
jgi:signal transduction histidine kinase